MPLNPENQLDRDRLPESFPGKSEFTVDKERQLENLYDDEDVPLVEIDEDALSEELIDWEGEADDCRSIKELIDLFGSGGAEQKALAQRIIAAQKYWESNKDAIVEGVLNTADDVSKPGYIDGSNSDIRNALGQIVRSMGNATLEKKVRDLMKEDMKRYFEENQTRLAQVAIKNAPSIPSLFEVVKRFRKIEEGGRTYTRVELAEQGEKIAALDGRIQELIRQYHQNKTVPSINEVENLYNAALVACHGLPDYLNIKNVAQEKIMEKIKELRVIAHAEKISSDSRSEEGQSWTARLTGRVKGWFGRK